MSLRPLHDRVLVTRLDGPNPKIVDLPGGDSRTLDVPPNTVFGSGAWAVDGSGIVKRGRVTVFTSGPLRLEV